MSKREVLARQSEGKVTKLCPLYFAAQTAFRMELGDDFNCETWEKNKESTIDTHAGAPLIFGDVENPFRK